jgi:hypothetical protein
VLLSLAVFFVIVLSLCCFCSCYRKWKAREAIIYNRQAEIVGRERREGEVLKVEWEE